MDDLTASIDGGDPAPCTLTLTNDVQYVPTDSAMKPDLAWTFRDTAGHFHAYNKDGGLPTLRTESVHVPCETSCGDETCEGYEATRYHCVICGHDVDPPMVPDTHARAVGIPLHARMLWELTVEGGPAFEIDGGQVSVVIRDGGRTLFGVAIVDSVNIKSGMFGPAYTLAHLSGIGPLGEMAEGARREAG